MSDIQERQGRPVTGTEGDNERLVRRVFRYMHGRFGNQWLDKWQTGEIKDGKERGLENAIAIWAYELEGYTTEEIKRGMNAKYSYPPSCDEFLQKCGPPLDYEAAYHHAVEQMKLRESGADHWPTPAIFWAVMMIGQHDFKALPYRLIEKRWKYALDTQLAKDVLPAIPEPSLQLPAPGKTQTTMEQGRGKIAELMQRFGWPRKG